MKPLGLALAGLFLVGGCSALPTNNQTPIPQEPPGVTPDPPPDDSESVRDLRDCRDGERIGAQNTVTAQTEALRAGDFEAAYTYASPSFQDTVSLEQFAGLILASYQPLLGEVVLEFGECVTDDRAEELSLDVVLRAEGQDSLGLRYILVDTDEGWRVSGASDFRLAGQST